MWSEASVETIDVRLAKEFLKFHSPPEVEILLTEVYDGDRQKVFHILEGFLVYGCNQRTTLNIFYKNGDTT